MSAGGYAIPFPRQPAAGTMPAMVTQATSPISPSSPLVAAARVRSAAAAAAAKESEEDELESLTSNEAVLEGGGKEALHSLPKVRREHSSYCGRLEMQRVSPFQRF